MNRLFAYVRPLITLSLVLAVYAAAVAAQSGRGAAPGPPASGGRRIALVIGNDRYSAGLALQNARRDAAAVAAELRAVGFQITQVDDATRAALIKALDTISNSLTPADVVVFFYAGHGVQIDGENYLVPIDYAGNSEQRLKLEAVSASQIQAWLARAQVSILVLDACRNNPYSGNRSAGGGLAPMEARGSLVAFATGAGQTAGDNPAGAQGIFTGALIEALRTPGLTFREIFFQVRKRVHDLSRGRQFPALYDGLLGDVVLRPRSETPVVITPSAAAPSAPSSAPPPPTAPTNLAVTSDLSRVPTWLQGDFRGLNAVTKTDVELTVRADGTMSGHAGAGTARAVAVQYQWVDETQQIRDPTGAYVFDVERTANGFRTRQVGSPSVVVDYRRIFMPPGTPAMSDARGARGARDLNRAASPDEISTMLAVVNNWKAAWETADGPAGRKVFPSWDVDELRREREKEAIAKVAAALTCSAPSVRRDQARLPCRVNLQIEFKRQLITNAGSTIKFGQKARPQTKATTWTFLLVWNGSTWLIDSMS